MSAEQRSPARSVPGRRPLHDGDPAGVRVVRSEDASLEASNRSRTEVEPRTYHPEVTDRQPLAHRIERTQLEARIAALERELRASERRRQDVIDQYERVLEGRNRGEEEASNEDGNDGSGESGTRARTALYRLFGGGRR